MSPDVELAESAKMLLAEAEKVNPLLEARNFPALKTVLFRIARLAHVGTYCISDMADFT